MGVCVLTTSSARAQWQIERWFPRWAWQVAGRRRALAARPGRAALALAQPAYFSVCSRRRRMVDRTVTEAAVLRSKKVGQGEGKAGMSKQLGWC